MSAVPRMSGASLTTRRGAPWHVAVVSLLSLATPSVGTAQHATATVVVKAHDYAFQVQDTVSAGTVSFMLENQGKMRHEFLIYRLHPGKTLKDVMAATTGEERRAAGLGLGIVFASPGERGPARLTVDLTSGQTYALVCVIRDGPDKPPHIALGMAKSIFVK